MFPWVYDFRWTVDHVVFLVIFFSVAILIFSTVVRALLRVFDDFKTKKHESIQWEVDFEDLPAGARVCRHELTGEVKQRTCDHEFDCRSCETHPVFLAKHAPAFSPAGAEQTMFGFSMPLDRLYHRGHTWVKSEGDGLYTIGLDDFGSRILGETSDVVLPEVGTQLQANGKGWLLKKQKTTLRVLAPIDGTVVEQGSREKGWYLKVRADESETSTLHLLRGEEVRPWVMRELERLQLSMAPGGVGMALADGGELMPDIAKQAPGVDWDGVWGEMFLEA